MLFQLEKLLKMDHKLDLIEKDQIKDKKIDHKLDLAEQDQIEDQKTDHELDLAEQDRIISPGGYRISDHIFTTMVGIEVVVFISDCKSYLVIAEGNKVGEVLLISMVEVNLFI